MKKPAIILDVDGTLANIDHRLHHVQGDKKRRQWDKFFKEMVNDSVNPWCAQIIERFRDSHKILLVSGRPDDYEQLTRDWLSKNFIHFDQLLMRKSKDFRRDDIVKEEIYKQHIEPNYNVLFCVDDRLQVVNKWRELGLICLACAKGDF